MKETQYPFSYLPREPADGKEKNGELHSGVVA